MKQYIKPTIGLLLGIIYFIFNFFLYPATWFIHGTLGNLGTPNLVLIVNSAIFFVVALITMGVLGYFKKLEIGMITKYGIVFLIALLVGLFAEFIGHFGDYSYRPTPELIGLDFLLGKFLRNASKVLCVTLTLKSLTYFNIPKFKNHIITVIGILLYLVTTIIYHNGFEWHIMLMYIMEAIGIGALTGYLVTKENAVITPMLFFGFFGYTNIPSYFALNSNTPISTAIILSILYFFIAVCFILFLCFKDKIKKEEDTKGNNFDNNTV